MRCVLAVVYMRTGLLLLLLLLLLLCSVLLCNQPC
jgi:hypothetical protein